MDHVYTAIDTLYDLRMRLAHATATGARADVETLMTRVTALCAEIIQVHAPLRSQIWDPYS
jgi:hypothetical protein